MTGTATTARRRTVVVISALAALALLAGPVASAAASAETATEPGSTPLTASSPVTRHSAVQTISRSGVSAGGTAADFSSIFAIDQPELAGSGWATCSAPITWAVDTGTLSDEESARALADMEWAFGQWAQASGLSFQFAGTIDLAYDDIAFSLKPADGSVVPSRNIFLAVVSDEESERMDARTVGLGSPSQVWPSTKEIVGGEAVFSTEHVRSAGRSQTRSLFMHELGHVLGLAHADDDANIMYSLVTDHVDLGEGDINGVRMMTKSCAS